MQIYELTYLDAWARWASGQQVQDFLLWGKPILWWGRMGKLSQFAAGLVFILDLIGPERLQAGAHKVGAYTWREASDRVERERYRYRRRRGLFEKMHEHDSLIYALRSDYSPPGETIRILNLYDERDREIRALPETERREYDRARLVYILMMAASMVTIVAGPIIALALLFHHHAILAAIPFGVFLIVFFTGAPLGNSFQLALVGSLSILFVRSLYAFFLLLPTSLLVQIMSAHRQTHWIRWLAFCIFVVGFHFDLLAS